MIMGASAVYQNMNAQLSVEIAPDSTINQLTS